MLPKEAKGLAYNASPHLSIVVIYDHDLCLFMVVRRIALPYAIVKESGAARAVDRGLSMRCKGIATSKVTICTLNPANPGVMMCPCYEADYTAT
jgi:hypothetical protein